MIVPVPKKGNLTKTDNYRGIALSSIVSKTLNRMVLNRIKPELDHLLRPNQNGFREGRSTTSHILALRRILEGTRAKNLSAVMLFIDFKKAFDSLHRGLLMKILRAYGIPNELVNLIEGMYRDTIAKVTTEDGLTEAFLILAGVMQGDTLAPYLFIIAIDYIMRTALRDSDIGLTLHPRRSRRYPAKKVQDADFADDLALLTNTIAEAQKFLHDLEGAANSVGLHLNELKTKYMSMNCHSANITAKSGKEIKAVDDFLYLGSWIRSSEHDFDVRKAKAWAACHQMKKIWKSGMKRDLKIRLFQATVESILFYGSETWTVSSSLSKRIDGCYTRMLRMALDISWKDRINNNTVYGNLDRASEKIRERRLKLAGHIQRHDDLLAHDLLFWDPQHGHRGPGRPHLTFVDVLKRDTELDSTAEIQSLMRDRELWRCSVHTRTSKPA